MDITAAMVNELRNKTGLPMMQCKKALVEAGGNMDKATDILRKGGAAVGQKLAGRETSQGRVACYVDGGKAGIIVLRCETAPVANTVDFQKLANLLAKQAANLDNATPESLMASKMADNPSRSVQDEWNEAMNRIRENMQLAKAARLTGVVGSYLHHNGQVGVIVQMSGECPDEVRTDVCMHAAAMRPMCTTREEVDPALVAKEREIAAELVKGKPPQIVDKIVSGKLDKWYSEIVLVEQLFVKDDKQTVGQYVASRAKGVTVSRFHRFDVGGA
ncbi:Elongation factor Ts [Phycisphaerae bacterium RAS1]|nr:Elongation factor Ts [Phycisphaerae bacterium RAS1]